jgi:hypothetical protein
VPNEQTSVIHGLLEQDPAIGSDELIWMVSYPVVNLTVTGGPTVSAPVKVEPLDLIGDLRRRQPVRLLPEHADHGFPKTQALGLGGVRRHVKDHPSASDAVLKFSLACVEGRELLLSER